MTQTSSLPTRIADTIREQKLCCPGDTLIIGLSGGADSTALLDLLAGLPGTPFHLVAAHLNHCLRGAESDADEEFCRELAQQYGIPFESRRVDVRILAENESLNLEDAGRRARIAFFDELLAARQAQSVVLAHHADDQAETVLMRLLRGSGMTGLAGMPYRNERGYCRPLLDITRSEIEAYLVERGLLWREDSTNLDTAYLRNRIRHELLPLLEQYNPAIRSSLATTATILSAENELLNDQAALAAERIWRKTSCGVSCSISLLKAQPLPLRRRIIRLALLQLQGNLERFRYHHIDAICRLLTSSRPNSTICLPGGIVAVKEYDALVFRHGETIHPDESEFRIPGIGVYQLFGNTLLTVERSTIPDRFDTNTANTAYFDLDKAPFPWHARTFLPGDRIRQHGLAGRKKVKNIFIDDKIPLLQRSRTPLVFCGEELLWVCGLRTSRDALLDSNSSHIVKVVFSRTE